MDPKGNFTSSTSLESDLSETTFLMILRLCYSLKLSLRTSRYLISDVEQEFYQKALEKSEWVLSLA